MSYYLVVALMTDVVYLDFVKVEDKIVAGTRNPDTGVFTPAVRCEPQGQPIGRLPRPLDNSDWRGL